MALMTIKVRTPEDIPPMEFLNLPRLMVFDSQMGSYADGVVLMVMQMDDHSNCDCIVVHPIHRKYPIGKKFNCKWYDLKDYEGGIHIQNDYESEMSMK